MNVIEISVDSLESAMAAQAGGAHRVELCSALREGGLTPSLGLIRGVRASLSIPVFLLIRPRSGDFLYTDEEFRVMREDIRVAAQEGVDGVVLGLLTAGGEVDRKRTGALVEIARPLPVTFHRAFDMACDQETALEQVIQCGANRILTSGGMPTAMLGREKLRTLGRLAGDRITVLAGGSVRAANVAELAQVTGLREFHSAVRRTFESPMQYRNAAMHLGDAGMDEYGRTGVRAEDVRSLVDAARAVTAN